MSAALPTRTLLDSLTLVPRCSPVRTTTATAIGAASSRPRPPACTVASSSSSSSTTTARVTPASDPSDAPDALSLRGMAELPGPGSTFAEKYVIESELGRGAAGVVFRAMHTGLRQHVAIKVLRDAGDVASERMAREARAAVTLQSEHVVRVMDVGRHAGNVFLVMEKLDGDDLGTLLKRRGSLPVAEAADYVLQACAGIAEAHARGIVHRDLKPSNLFLTQRADGSPLVKVLDFGISKGAASGDDEASLTGTAEVLGSPMYMAPEQVRGARNADQRSDVWSLGVIVFKLITGKGPFQTTGGVSAALASVVADEPRRLRELAPDAPRELEALILHCMKKDPSERVGSISELVTKLAPFGTAQGRAAVIRLMMEQDAPKRPRRRAVVIAGAAVAAVVLFAGLLLARARHPMPPTAAMPAAPSAADTGPPTPVSFNRSE